MKRIRVVGNSGAGKTTFARRVSMRTGLPFIELDEMNFGPNWVQVPPDQFRQNVLAKTSELEVGQGGWIMCGNYNDRLVNVVDADTYLWLDYNALVIFRRLLFRTIRRMANKETLWGNNSEKWRSLLNKDPNKNILLWMLTQQRRKRQMYASEMRHSPAVWLRFRTSRQAERWLEELFPSESR